MSSTIRDDKVWEVGDMLLYAFGGLASTQSYHLAHLPLAPHRYVRELGQVMACRLHGAKPLSKPMLTYCQLDPLEHISVKFESKF